MKLATVYQLSIPQCMYKRNTPKRWYITEFWATMSPHINTLPYGSENRAGRTG